MSQLTKGYLIAIVGVTFWSTTGIFIGYIIANYEMPPLLIAFWRNLLLCIALSSVLFAVRRSLLQFDTAQIRFYVFFGLVLACFNSIWMLSIQANGAAVATVLAYSSAGFTVFLARLIFKETLGIPKITAVILSLIGCVLVSNAYDPQMWQLNPMGVITGLMSGVLFACYNMLGKEATRRHINTWTSLLYSFVFGSVFVLMFNLLPLLPGTAGSLIEIVPELPVNGWLILIFLAFVPTLLGFGLYNASMNYLPASIVSLIATSEPALTAIGAYIVLNERMTMIQIMGSLIILSAIIIVRFEKVKQPALIPNTA